MKNTIFLIASIVLAAWGCQFSNEATDTDLFYLENQLNAHRTEVVNIDLNSEIKSLKEGMGKIGSTPIEAIDDNNDGVVDRLLAYVSIEANNSLTLDLSAWEVDSNFKKKTQAEISTAVGGEWKEREYLESTGFRNVDILSVPKSHTDHSWYIRYEGPGWENELVGYRFYLDWRNAVDIFGKKVDTLVLQNVGQDGFDSYHEEADWGMDILKAGKSLGIGSIGRVNNDDVVEHFEKTDSVTCEITQNGFLSSSITTNYYGWETSNGKCDLASELTINAGDRATIHKVSFDEMVNNFCTGIVKHPAAEFFEASSNKWSYIATYGSQTLFDDNLGMAIFYQNEQLLKIDTTDAFNQLIIFKPSKNIEYQFLGAWEKDPEGIPSKEVFISYLNKKLEALNSPIEIQ